MAVRAQYADVVKDEQGRPIAAASIAVYQPGTTTAITETIYDDATGAGTLSNPLTADSAGRFQFYLVQPKRVDLYVSKTGYTTYTLEDVDVMGAGSPLFIEGWVLDNAQNPTLGTLPANAIVTAVDLWVEESFNAGGSDSLTVGYDGDTDAYVKTGLNMATDELREHVTEDHGSAGDVLGKVDATSRSVEAYMTHTGAEPTTGKAYIIVHYIVATAQPA